MFSNDCKLTCFVMFLRSVSVIRATSCKALDTDDGLRDWYKNYETNVCRIGNRMVLPQLNPVKIGKVRQLELEPGRFFDVKTVATKPPIFLIPNFLTIEECDKIKQLAQDKGLARSTVLPTATIDKASVDIADPFYNAETFSKLDLDGDNLLDFTEVLDALHEHEIEIAEKYTTAQVEYILSIYVDINSDRYLTELEFRRIPAVKSIHMAQWLSHQLTETEEEARVKRGPHRRSEQTWLRVPQYDFDWSITNRIIKLTGLHPDIIKASDTLQVVQYTPGGHYHSHYDSHALSESACQHTETTKTADNRICRYITILYYLNDVTEGGQTAFPVADNETYTAMKYMKNDKLVNPFDLANHCLDSNLVVEAQKGMAVLWYNHERDPQTGWLGEMNQFSLHGGCDVIKGEKWIANSWIYVDDNYELQMKFHEDRNLENAKEKAVL